MPKQQNNSDDLNGLLTSAHNKTSGKSTSGTDKSQMIQNSNKPSRSMGNQTRKKQLESKEPGPSNASNTSSESIDGHKSSPTTNPQENDDKWYEKDEEYRSLAERHEAAEERHKQLQTSGTESQDQDQLAIWKNQATRRKKAADGKKKEIEENKKEPKNRTDSSERWKESLENWEKSLENWEKSLGKQSQDSAGHKKAPEGAKGPADNGDQVDGRPARTTTRTAQGDTCSESPKLANAHEQAGTQDSTKPGHQNVKTLTQKFEHKSHTQPNNTKDTTQNLQKNHIEPEQGVGCEEDYASDSSFDDDAEEEDSKLPNQRQDLSARPEHLPPQSASLQQSDSQSGAQDQGLLEEATGNEDQVDGRPARTTTRTAQGDTCSESPKLANAHEQAGTQDSTKPGHQKRKNTDAEI